jgi:hypothetical protein
MKYFKNMSAIDAIGVLIFSIIIATAGTIIVNKLYRFLAAEKNQ